MERWQSKAILEINPNAEYNFTIGEDGSISEIDWKNNTTPISMEEINVKANEIKNRIFVDDRFTSIEKENFLTSL